MSHSGFFIRAREEEKRWMEGERETERERAAALSGEEVRDFYQSLVEDEDGVRRDRRRGRAGRTWRREDAALGEPVLMVRESETCFCSFTYCFLSDRKSETVERCVGKCVPDPPLFRGSFKVRKLAARKVYKNYQEGHGKGGGAREGEVKSLHGEVENSATAPPAGRTEGYRLLQCAEQGDVRGVEAVLRRGCDVNFRDQFNWTALMSASYSGRTNTVRVLLQRGALWASITDTQGRDARALARLAGHHDVVTLLERFSITHNSHTAAEPIHSPPPPQWCDVCEVCYTDSVHTHTSSTLHQFSLKRPPSVPHYCLAPSSVGYRVMLRLGWDPHSGLGPEHSGRLGPVGTVLKSDTAGLGFRPTPRSKVTHFKANDVQAVRRAPKRRGDGQERGTAVSAKDRKRTEERQRQWERDYRTSFNIDT